jgi:hypothetical protein
MAEKEAKISFAALLRAADQYVGRGLPLAEFTPWEAQRLNLLNLPAGGYTRSDSSSQWWQNLWLGMWDGSMIGIGIAGDYEDLQPLVRRYGSDAADVFFPFPAKLAAGRKRGSGQLLMIFTPAGLEHAAGEHSVGRRRSWRP